MMADQQQLAGASLHQLLQGLVDSLPEVDCRIGGIALDSRDIEPGDAFLALHGYREDGSQYIADAAARGAAVILLEEGLKTSGVDLPAGGRPENQWRRPAYTGHPRAGPARQCRHHRRPLLW